MTQIRNVSLILTTLTLLPATAHATAIYTYGGYETLKPAKSEVGDEMNGLSLGATVQFDFYSAGMISALGGAGIRHSNISGKVDTPDKDPKVTFRNTWGLAELGVDAAVVPLLLNVQLTGSYEFGFGGNVEVEGISTKAKVDPSNRMAINARGLVTLFPFVKAGLEFSMHNGSLKTVADDAEKTSTTSDFSGMGIRGILGVSF